MSVQSSHERINFYVPSKFELSIIHQLYAVAFVLALLNASLYFKNLNPGSEKARERVSQTQPVSPAKLAPIIAAPAVVAPVAVSPLEANHAAASVAVAPSAVVTNSVLLERVPAQTAPSHLISQGQELILRSDRLFDSGTAKLSTHSAASIAQVKALIQQLDSTSTVEIEGYTDNVPVKRQKKFYPSNWELSAARAAALIPFFENAGIAKNRLKIVGFGESRPLSSESNPASAHHRRLVIRVIPKGDVGI